MEIKKILELLDKNEKEKSYIIKFSSIDNGNNGNAWCCIHTSFYCSTFSNPSIVREQFFTFVLLYNQSRYFGVENLNQFLFFLGIGVFIFLISSLSLRAITSYFQIRYAMMLEYNLSKRLTEGYLNQPYSWFLKST